MADDQIQRPYRSNEPPVRSAPAAAPSSGSDPLAELARLIGQNDPFAEFGRDSARRAAPRRPTRGGWPPSRHAPERPRLRQIRRQRLFRRRDCAAPRNAPHAGIAPALAAPSPRPPISITPNATRPAIRRPQAGGYEPTPIIRATRTSRGEEEDFYDDVPPPRRRMGIMAIAAVFALAVIGTAGAFGYRALFGSSGIEPAAAGDQGRHRAEQDRAGDGQQGRAIGKLITDRVADHAQGEKLVSREEQPVEIKDKPAAMAMPQAQDSAPSAAAQPRHSAAASSPASRRKSTPSPSVPIRRHAPIANRWRHGAAASRRPAGAVRRPSNRQPAATAAAASNPPSWPIRDRHRRRRASRMRAPRRRCVRPRRRRPAMRRYR